MESQFFEEWLKKYAADFAPVVPFNPQDKLLLLDFTDANIELTDEVLNDTNKFIVYINTKLKEAGAKYGVGGYAENRMIYKRSKVFDEENSSRFAFAVGDRGTGAARSLHLGIDIWGTPYTKVMTPANGIVHSFGFNNAYGDYGATIILTHNLNGKIFHTLYGHLSLNSIKNLHEGDAVYKGDVIAEFGLPFENGQWPPHLHFQIIKDMQGAKGDYPGVCAPSESKKYLANCPNPDLILKMMQYAVKH
ncbi:MAG TPA: peptidoglycan DD-metalloendopeptidase family protein [Flavisolibacter sp.]|nr:peptidoglycan DD-metalloendopeptidase family protein [Flavisolibacter sp.]